MPTAPQTPTDTFVVVTSQNGISLIPKPTPLTRLHFFDGKFLKAADLTQEQNYLRCLVALSNQAGGAGVVHGFDTTVSTTGDELILGPGMAIDPAGRVLLLPATETRLSIQDLINASMQMTAATAAATLSGSSAFAACATPSAPAPSTGPVVPQASNLFLITVGFAEALCGTEDVFGKLCEEACITSKDRPFLVEGLIVRAIPWTLQTPLATSTTVSLGSAHLRSLVASAFFADELAQVGSLISGAGLKNCTWCLGAQLAGGSDVPLALIGRSGSTTSFFDAWSARRERMEAPARRYWAQRMSMRPLDVYLAQILQFQCQLKDVLLASASVGAADPQAINLAAITTAVQLIQSFQTFYRGIATTNPDIGTVQQFPGGLTAIQQVQTQLTGALQGQFNGPRDRILIRGGIVELPPAGYLPVTPGTTVSVNQQVRQLLGEGLDYQFCVVRHDFVAHALEEAQHMDRISLLHGLDVPSEKPEVDILVPDGTLLPAASPADLAMFRAAAALTIFNKDRNQLERKITVDGVTRLELLSTGGAAFYLAGISPPTLPTLVTGTVGTVFRTGQANLGTTGFQTAALGGADTGATWLTGRIEKNPFTMAVGDTTSASGRGLLVLTGGPDDPGFFDLTLRGDFQVTSVIPLSATSRRVQGILSVIAQAHTHTTRPDGTVKDESKCGARMLQTTLTLEGDSQTGLFSGEASDPSDTKGTKYALSVNWKGTPQRVHVAGTIADNTRANNGGPQAILVRDPAVLELSNPAHSLAVQALDVIGVTIHDSLFASSAEKTLFPPPPASLDEVTVRATRDWVLFHRRRTKTCALTPPPKTALAPTRLRVLYLADTTAFRDNAGPSLIQILETGNDAALLQIATAAREVDVIEFEFGRSALRSSLDAFFSDWQAVNPGNYLLVAAIGDNISTDTDPLDNSRLDVIDAAISRVTDISQEKRVTLTRVPAPFATATSDGFILLAVSERRCHNVYQILVNNTDQLGQIIKAFDSSSPTPIMQYNPTLLTSVSFKLGLTAIDQGKDALVSAWVAATPRSTVLFAASYERPGVAAEPMVVSARAKNVALAVDSTYADAPRVQQDTGGAITANDCPVWTFLVAMQQVLDKAILLTTNAAYASDQASMDRYFQANHSVPGGIRQELMTSVKYSPGSVPDSANVNSLVGELKAINGATPIWRLVLVSRTTDANSLGARLSALADALQKAGITQPPNANGQPGFRAFAVTDASFADVDLPSGDTLDDLIVIMNPPPLP